MVEEKKDGDKIIWTGNEKRKNEAKQE